MKKCPYCYTLMNDDVEKCPHCLKDMKEVNAMGEVAPKDNKISYYTLVFGVLISIGSLIASFSLRKNRMNYLEQYNSVKSSFNATTDSSIRDSLAKQGEAIMTNIKTCQFREVAFYIMCAIGVVMVIYTITTYLIKRFKKKRKRNKIS